MTRVREKVTSRGKVGEEKGLVNFAEESSIVSTAVSNGSLNRWDRWYIITQLARTISGI